MDISVVINITNILEPFKKTLFQLFISVALLSLTYKITEANFSEETRACKIKLSPQWPGIYCECYAPPILL